MPALRAPRPPCPVQVAAQEAQAAAESARQGWLGAQQQADAAAAAARAEEGARGEQARARLQEVMQQELDARAREAEAARTREAAAVAHARKVGQAGWVHWAGYDGGAWGVRGC